MASLSASAVVALPAVLAGCSSPAIISVNAPVDPAGVMPSDLSLEVVVTPGARVEDRVRIEERPARFVLLPDGSLHGEADRIPPEGVRPARIRRLSREQMADVWSALESAGFSQPLLADARAAAPDAEPLADEVLVSLEVHADGARFGFLRRYRPGSDSERAIRQFVRTVAALAWASDEALAESAELPTRYDLGPDPYARFAPRLEPRKDGAP